MQFYEALEKQNGLVSLLEMLKFSAADWNEIIRELEALQNALNTKLINVWLEGDREGVITPLKKISESCDHLGLNFSRSYAEEIIGLVAGTQSVRESIKKFLGQLRKGGPKQPSKNAPDDKELTPQILQEEINILRKRIDDELNGRDFFALEQKWTPYFYEAFPFGREVNSAIPRAIKDIEEAGKCLALERSTACVFHLMRVMEISLQQLGNKLEIGMEFLEDAQWNNILEKLDKTIRALPRGTREEKEVQGRYGEVSSHLFAVKNAWRNDVMHVRGIYTQEDAAEIFNHVKAFTRNLATKIL